MSVNQYINAGSNIFQYGAGSWNFFGGTQATMNVMASKPNDLHFYGLIDHGARYIMRLPNGTRFGDGSENGCGGNWDTLVAEYSSSA